MNKTLKKRWVKALRSGEYKQGRSVLCMDDQYCCLGVLYDQLDVWWVPDEREPGRWMTEDGDAGTLPGSVLPHSVQTKLIDMNDEYDQNFDEIADWIEANI